MSPLSNFARRLVSGNKARFRDDELGVDLDLAYLTDRIIMMGYPASGVESFYRNKGEDVRKFLQHRHPGKYWVFNFCPLSENSYPPSFFDNRVSRYPFPDHHAPPLAVLALAVREMSGWLDGDQERVVVLHCKAGKGRTGTLACAYLLSLKQAPEPPRLQRSYTEKQWARLTAEKLIRAVDSESDTDTDNETARQQKIAGSLPSDNAPKQAKAEDPKLKAIIQGNGNGEASSSQTHLDAVLQLHTSRRMKPPEKEAEKLKRGVSIASQRRFLSYWSILLLAPTDAPPKFWVVPRLPPEERPKVYLTEIRVRMSEASSNIMRNAIKAVSSALEMTRRNETQDKGNGDVWVSLSRYDDALVDLLEEWEVKTRDPTNLGRRKAGTGEVESTELGAKVGVHGIFADGKWDKDKMVKSFARLGEHEGNGDIVEATEEGSNRIHILHPLPANAWVHVEKPAQASKVNGEPDNSSTTDLQGASETELEEEGVLLEADREVRAKLYMGEVPFGWFWFIPAFHMPVPKDSKRPLSTEMKLVRKDVDFPLGPGSWLVDLTLKLRWAGAEAAGVPMRSPKKTQTPDNAVGLAASAVAEGQVTGVVDAVQGDKD